MEDKMIPVQVVQPFRTVRLTIPKEVRLIGDQVAWRGEKKPKAVLGVVEAIDKLAEGSDKQIKSFVGRWGALKIRPLEQEDGWLSEPMEMYRVLAKQLRAIKAISQRLAEPSAERDGMSFREEVEEWFTAAAGVTDARWMSLIGQSQYQDEMPPVVNPATIAEGAPSVVNQREQFARLVTEHLIKPGCIRPVVDWTKTDAPVLKLETDCYEEIARWNIERSIQIETFKADYPELVARDCPILRSRPSRLFSVVALQIVGLISSPNGFISCSTCDAPYELKRSNASGINNCPACQAKNKRRIDREYDRRRRPIKVPLSAL